MELTKNQELNLEKNNTREDFLNSTLWKTINNGIDIGLRYALPDFMEDEIIDLKNNLVNFGLKEGIKKSIDSVIETGKQTIGIFTGNFENIGQVQKVVKNGGLIDKVSDMLDVTINKAQDSGKINSTMSKALKSGKNSILTSVERNIEATLNNQISSAKNIDKYISNWKEYYQSQDFTGMQKEYIKMEKELKELMPLENTLKNARYVENIHNLIKNNGQNFELSEEELELVNKFSN